VSDLPKKREFFHREEESRCIRAAQKGSREAFDVLVLRYTRNVYGFAMVLTGNPEDAWDVSQETFVKAFRKIRTYGFKAPFCSWLLSITRNTFKDRARKELNIRAKHEAMGRDIPVTREDFDPEDVTTAKEKAAAVHRALERVDEPFREVVHLFDIQGFSYAEVAVVCDVAMGTVKSRLRRGRDALRKELIKEGLVGKQKKSHETDNEGGGCK
jgi:RNA polymerase sigma-70 factor, ECF subfamily